MVAVMPSCSSSGHVTVIIRQRLLLSGDVELNPGPLDQGIIVALCNKIYIYLCTTLLMYTSTAYTMQWIVVATNVFLTVLNFHGWRSFLWTAVYCIVKWINNVFLIFMARANNDQWRFPYPHCFVVLSTERGGGGHRLIFIVILWIMTAHIWCMCRVHVNVIWLKCIYTLLKVAIHRISVLTLFCWFDRNDWWDSLNSWRHNIRWVHSYLPTLIPRTKSLCLCCIPFRWGELERHHNRL